MSTIINGLSLQNYRGIGQQKQTIKEFKQFNFFIGKNNSGKSTILNFLSSLCPSHFEHAFMHYHPVELDFHKGDLTQAIEYELIFEKSRFAEFVTNSATTDVFMTFEQKFLDEKKEEVNSISSKVQKLIHSKTDLKFSRKIMGTLRNGTLALDEVPKKSWLKKDELEEILKNASLGEEADNVFIGSKYELTQLKQANDYDYIKIHEKIERFLSYTPIKCVMIPAIREIRNVNGAHEKHDGTNLFKALLELSNPRQESRLNRAKFKLIEKFLSTLIEETDVELIVAHDASEIQVSINNEPLPLSNLGTGIQELVIIATYCTLNDNCVICIEEPEIHLHSTLQRKLIKYLEGKTSNQYFIATHSTTIIDCLSSEKSSIFHVTKNNEQTLVKPAYLTTEKIELCRDLGYKASDLFQTNFIIWVEGPSDRIYLLKWLNQIDKDILEGIHFSILFYGGRILSHFSADIHSEELIKLHPLNTNMAVFIDSDKSHIDDKINDTKNRILNEFSKDGSLCLIRPEFTRHLLICLLAKSRNRLAIAFRFWSAFVLDCRTSRCN